MGDNDNCKDKYKEMYKEKYKEKYKQKYKEKYKENCIENTKHKNEDNHEYEDKELIKEYKKLDSYIEYIQEENKKLEELNVVKKAAELFGGVPKEVQKHIAKKLDISKERVRGVMKYNSINESIKGKYHISVCMGTTCISKGAHEILEAVENQLGIRKGEMTSDGMYSIGTTGCIKYCVMAPILSVNGKIYSQVKLEEVKDIIGNIGK